MSDPSLATQILNYHFQLKTDVELPDRVEWLYPYDVEAVQQSMQAFFSKYFSDTKRRFMLVGINPGRFGAGITGLPFTDPIRMESACGLENNFKKRQELSSVFVYDVIDAMGGPAQFYRDFYITSICPLGFVKDGKNYNYYDSKELTAAVMPLILDNFKRHLEMGFSDQVAFSMGQGKNFKFLQQLNAKHGFFKEVHPLPHPRWVMQYRLKRKLEFVDQYVETLGAYL